MKNQSNQNNEKSRPVKPVKGKAAEDDRDVVGRATQDAKAEGQSASDKPEQTKAVTATEKDMPKVTGKAAQKKPETGVEKKPPTTTEKTNTAAEKEESPPKNVTVKTADATEMGETEEKKGSAGLFVAILALLLAVLAALGVYYLYLQGQQQNQQSAALAEHLGELQSGIDANRQQLTQLSQLETLKQEISTIRSEVDSAASVRQRIEAEQQALNAALTQMSATLGRTTLAWRLAEVEYLLIVANTRLTLERDRRTAQVALQTADQKLRAIGDPAFVPVRQSIANEIAALKAMVEPDITGLALSLVSLVERVESLPLRDSQPARAAGPAVTSGQEDYQSLDWIDIPSAVWKDIRGLVVVRRADKPIEPLQPPSEAWFLRQNLQLKLEQARLSLLRYETALFQQLLDEAGDWLEVYFDAESAAVKSMLESLQDLKRANLQPSLPDISDSLRILRKHMRSLGVEVEAAQREGSEQ